jgi:hypothetical protein
MFVVRLINSEVLLRRQVELSVGWTTKVTDPDECIGGRTDVIVTIAPRVESDAGIESGFRREWGPANIIVVIGVPPRYPGRGPLTARKITCLDSVKVQRIQPLKSN